MIDADGIADALGLPRPTAEQRAVIEAPLAPSLVIAGAGSGKTETMANRVLWLLANGHAEAGDILGLTFTRKASGELGTRIRERIAQLATAGLIDRTFDPLSPPSVSTYNSFANSIYRDNAVLIARESDAVMLGEASAWQLARSIVLESDDPRLATLDKSVDAITRAVISLAHELSENVVVPGDVRAMGSRFATVAELPPGGRGAYEDVAVVASTVGALPLLTDLAVRFAETKRQRGLVEYSDQVALALEVIRAIPRVADDLRRRYAVVLLDEYQDTSVVQTWLLSAVFASHPVMAVGDPNQSIYGWRGASASNLGEFSRQFASGSAHEFALSTSWRNGSEILRVANAIVDGASEGPRTRVRALNPAPGASERPVDVVMAETVADEAEAVARWLADRMRAGASDRLPSAAILFRTRKFQDEFIHALRRHRLPFHVLGISGLLAEPEIADLVCALAVISDPAAGSELVRLLSGSRWRIGAADLRALSRVASWLSERDYAQRLLGDDLRETMRASVADDDAGSIVDALDFVAHARPEHSQLRLFSEVGLPRLRAAGRMLAGLRARASVDLVDFVTLVEQELMLDIELAANESRSDGSANIDAFFDALANYRQVSERVSLDGFLGWLREADWREALSPRPEDPEPGTIQLLTVHGAKGLEWDHVAVPRLVEDEFPSKPREGFSGWLSFGSLPYEFRGDRDDLPSLGWGRALTRKEFIAERDAFRLAVRARHESEERRLAYVAVTRARTSLMLSGSFWADQKNPRGPSLFLTELGGRGLVGSFASSSKFEVSPADPNSELIHWPMDPLGDRRARVERAAELVRTSSPGFGGRWDPELDLLFEERRRKKEEQSVVEPPVRVPASRFKDYVTDPARVASMLRRPMPQKPYRATRLGTLFHTWVEERAGHSVVSDTIDPFDSELDYDHQPDEHARLEALQRTFEGSPWAMRRPIEVEREIHLPFDGRIIVCKLDAVYESGGRFDVVDWKTGKAPRDSKDLEQRQLQLALYRLAYAAWAKIDPSRVDVCFYFVADDLILRPERVFTHDELVHLWRSSVMQPQD